MGTNKTSRLRVGNVIACTLMLLVFVFVMIMYTSADGGSVQKNSCSLEQSEVIPLLSKDFKDSLLAMLVDQNEVEAGPKEEVVFLKRTEMDDYITTYLDDIKFLSYALSVNYEDIIDGLYEEYDKNHEQYGFDENNVGYILNADGTLNSYSNAKYGLVEYIYSYIDKYPKKKTTRRVAYTGKADYVEDLIRYYSSIYTNVDTNLALSIGAAESGYYKVKYMLKAGNVYGGMKGGKLIHYDNIEIGVLSYVRLLSKSYFGKGLKTVQSIGYKYNPIIDENGNKVASPHWVGLVNSAMVHYKKLNNGITASDLLKEK
ncbi:MAG: hypothetical protein K5666_00270 [Bacilli bacterium]|nr:hypothetical protein [Bacilli bacterium]